MEEQYIRPLTYLSINTPQEEEKDKKEEEKDKTIMCALYVWSLTTQKDRLPIQVLSFVFMKREKGKRETWYAPHDSLQPSPILLWVLSGTAGSDTVKFPRCKIPFDTVHGRVLSQDEVKSSINKYIERISGGKIKEISNDKMTAILKTNYKDTLDVSYALVIHTDIEKRFYYSKIFFRLDDKADTPKYVILSWDFGRLDKD